MNARQIIASLLDEAFVPDYSDPMGRDYAAERGEIAQQLAMQHQKQLQSQEREAGLETEREMAEEEKLRREREAAARKKGTLLHGTRLKARDYFRSPERKTWPKMPEIERTGEVLPTDFGTKKQEPEIQIKGAQKYQPKHYIMPKPWKHWQ
jgi:hypothetical protein